MFVKQVEDTQNIYQFVIVKNVCIEISIEYKFKKFVSQWPFFKLLVVCFLVGAERKALNVHC